MNNRGDSIYTLPFFSFVFGPDLEIPPRGSGLWEHRAQAWARRGVVRPGWVPLCHQGSVAPLLWEEVTKGSLGQLEERAGGPEGSHQVLQGI